MNIDTELLANTSAFNPQWEGGGLSPPCSEALLYSLMNINKPPHVSTSSSSHVNAQVSLLADYANCVQC